MRAIYLFVGLLFLTARIGVVAKEGAAAKTWAMNATAIEACSCPMFCQCYFNTKPAGHAGHAAGEGSEHFCKFNMAYKVNRGNYGDTKLDGAKFWIAGDLGGDFSKGDMDWAVLTFDPAVTPEQREGIKAILPQVFPAKWKSFSVAADAPVSWTASREHAEGKLDNGKLGEVTLTKFKGMTDEPVVVQNLKYWGAPRNDGFIMMPNDVEAYRTGDKAFEYKGTNGFMITIDIASTDVKTADEAKM